MFRLMLRSLVISLSLITVALAGERPDLSLTPGVSRPGLTTDTICKIKWGKDERHVTEAMKKQVVEAYHFTPDECPSGRVEYDHLVSRELGGADDVHNLWPQCYEKSVVGEKPSEVVEWGAHKKDRLENYLHRQVCTGKMSLEDAQHALTDDWIKAYQDAFGSN